MISGKDFMNKMRGLESVYETQSGSFPSANFFPLHPRRIDNHGGNFLSLPYNQTSILM
jgi:hypothetical protein